VFNVFLHCILITQPSVWFGMYWTVNSFILKYTVQWFHSKSFKIHISRQVKDVAELESALGDNQNEVAKLTEDLAAAQRLNSQNQLARFLKNNIFN